MVADLFHFGHSDFLKKMYEMKNKDDKIYVGIHNDETVESYKRTPVLTMDERIKVMSSCKYVDKIIPNAPLTIDKEYLDLHKIDLICIPDNRTLEEIQLMVKIPYELGIVKMLPYSKEISTTDIIKKIKSRQDL
jgi:cytidyltransferase-like protein